MSSGIPNVLWLASWPRSGNTMLRQILWKRFGLRSTSTYNESTSLSGNEVRRGAIGSEESLDALLDQQWVPVKTHSLGLPYPGVAIRIVRDGRDACCSAAAWKSDARCYVEEQTRLHAAIRGQTVWGSWSDHHDSLCDVVDLTIRFEDMLDIITRETKVIPAIEKLLGIPRSYTPLHKFETLHKDFPEFFDRGESGRWRDEMNEDACRLFWSLHGDTMRDLGYATQAVPG